ncbi:hypothetical protein PIB30_069297 [Stylosanthes scabra]|uniref:Uncharacterized protein n=1 Tax=Stylosanthes scabra TaxID=79078 RepID=A0ABU6RP28_9FABA|nr:hypothetical protein [Stylosanthes scabra]
MGYQVSMIEVRRCAFDDKPYGVAESYCREGIDVEVNSPRSPEIGLWDSRSNRAYQGRRLFDAFEESIQEFKWHYFKVLPLPGSRPFWLDDEGKPFPWVYWNSGMRECRITALDPLETLAFEFLQSLLFGLGRKSNFRCRWILDHSDAEVGIFLDSLLTNMEKQRRYDCLKQKMAEAAGVGPRSVLPHVRTPPTTSGASASSQAVPAPAPVASITPVPPSVAAKKKGSSRDPAGKPFSVDG